MPLQNRVLPTGEIVAIAARGQLTGNRGIIHGPDRVLGPRRWSHHAWICCTLDWQSRTREVMTGRNWTELFFLDEAVAFAAGHRPCGYCRRAAYQSFVAAWERQAGARPSAKQMDKNLHAARIIPRQRTQQTYQADLSDLPAGAMIMQDGHPHLLGTDHMQAYRPTGYMPAIDRPRAGTTEVLTPRPTVAVLQAGYDLAVHPTATL